MSTAYRVKWQYLTQPGIWHQSQQFIDDLAGAESYRDNLLQDPNADNVELFEEPPGGDEG